jgi:hypothetical protein
MSNFVLDVTGFVITDPRDGAETAKEPPKRWRNWWRALTFNHCANCGSPAEAGEIHVDCCTRAYPSKDLAETNAVRAVAYQMENSGRALDEHLGAFPDGERP